MAPSTGARDPHRVEVQGSVRLLDDFFRVDRVELRHEQFDGTMSDTITRILFDRGDSAAVLPYDPDTLDVVLIRQFRYPAHVRGGPGWLWEIIAGAQHEDDPEAVARREAEEEAGLTLGPLEHVATVYPSPGACSERVYIYLAPLPGAMPAEGYGGLVEEEEDILIRVFSLDEALAMVARGEIVDAKTVLALQHLALGRAGR
jgi:ADP-ribose pyrophosphatase